MWTDIRAAARSLATHRTPTLAAVAVLSPGMAATTTMFTIIHGVYLRDLPFVDAERGVAIATRHFRRGPGALDNWSALDLRDVQASARALIIGLAIGIGGAMSVGAVLQNFMSGVSGRDPVTLVGVAALIAMATGVACLVPAVGARRLDPVAALRVD